MATKICPRVSWGRRFFHRSTLLNSQEVTSFNVAEEKELLLQDPVLDKGIPFLFLPHTVKKAYIVHETASTNLPNSFDKYKWLTKTISSPNLPSRHKLTETISDASHLAFHDSILQTIAFQRLPRNKDMKRYIPERIKFSLISNLLNISFMENNNKEHLNPLKSLLCYEPILETHWSRNYKFYQTKCRPTFVLKTTNGFGVVEEPQEVYPDDIENIPGSFDPYSLNSYRRPIVHLTNRPCLDNARFSPFKHCHTTVSINNRLRNDEQLYTLGMFTMFAQLCSQAQTSGVHHGTELHEPLVTQCIVTNGHQIAFMIYQLNTLHMLDDKGVWNRCWYSPVMELYEQKNSGPWNVYEEAKLSNSLEGYNKDICSHFISLIGKETYN